jgi:hypothetical protein
MVKVKSHCGELINQRADTLAEEATRVAAPVSALGTYKIYLNHAVSPHRKHSKFIGAIRALTDAHSRPLDRKGAEGVEEAHGPK